MKLTTIALAGAFALSSTLAFAQSSGGSTAGSTCRRRNRFVDQRNRHRRHGGHGNRIFDHGHDLAEWQYQ